MTTELLESVCLLDLTYNQNNSVMDEECVLIPLYEAEVVFASLPMAAYIFIARPAVIAAS